MRTCLFIGQERYFFLIILFKIMLWLGTQLQVGNISINILLCNDNIGLVLYRQQLKEVENRIQKIK